MPNPALYAPVFGVSQLQTNPDRQAERRVAAQLPLPMSFFCFVYGCVCGWVFVGLFQFHSALRETRDENQDKIKIYIAARFICICVAFPCAASSAVRCGFFFATFPHILLAYKIK